MDLFPTHFLFYPRPSYTLRIGKPFRTQVVYLFTPSTKVHLIEGKCVYPGEREGIITYILSVLRNSKSASYTTTITTYIQHEREREKKLESIVMYILDRSCFKNKDQYQGSFGTRATEHVF